MSIGGPAGDHHDEHDQSLMHIALAMARRGLGTTAPNPSVGAVVFDPASRTVVSRGWTQPGGRPHAETVALSKAGAAARGATLYVTLEPCSHHGRTPPCADAIIAAGIKRVVCGIEDPDPRVSGRGLDRLVAAGIEVSRFVQIMAADRITRGHILRVTERRPFVQVKLAVAADGSVARGVGGRPIWVTGELARALGHRLRAEADAILVGAGTVRDDDPELTCRLPGAAHRSPIRVVLSRRGQLPEAARLLASVRAVATWVVCGVHTPAASIDRLAATGARVFRVAEIDGGLWLPAVTELLAAEGVTRLLVEGGPQMWQAFARAGMVDEVVLFAAGGGDSVPPDAQATARRYLSGIALEPLSYRSAAGDHVFVLRTAVTTRRRMMTERNEDQR